MSAPGDINLRLLRKGTLAQETYRLFQAWDFSLSLEANLNSALDVLHGTSAWKKEIRTTLRRRFRNYDEARALILLANRGLPFDEWLCCLLLWICRYESVFGDFSAEWLYPRYESGHTVVRAEEVAPFYRQYWSARRPDVTTEYSIVRGARDLLKMAADLGVLKSEGIGKSFARVHLSDRCLLYWAHVLAEEEGSFSKVASSYRWRWALMSSSAIEHELLRLHQFRQLEYQVAGSLVQLTLPCGSSTEYAERMVA